MRLVTVVRFARSGGSPSGMSEKEKQDKQGVVIARVSFTHLFFSPALSVALLLLIRLFVVFCIYLSCYFRLILVRFSYKGSRVLILISLSSAPPKWMFLRRSIVSKTVRSVFRAKASNRSFPGMRQQTYNM